MVFDLATSFTEPSEALPSGRSWADNTKLSQQALWTDLYFVPPIPRHSFGASETVFGGTTARRPPTITPKMIAGM